MDTTLLGYYKLIGEMQASIASASALDEALRGCLNTIVESSHAQCAAIWYVDKKGDGRLRPYYWIGPVDLTSKSHLPGEGSVGRVFESQHAERAFDFAAARDSVTVLDYQGIDVGSMLCVPFSSTYEDLGCIQFVNSVRSPQFTEEEADLCEIMAMMAAIAIDENEGIQEPWQPGKAVMSLRNITREFKNGDTVTKVLKGVNLDVYEGEFLVLLGESGCGKSTLLNIIGGMDQATTGSFTYLDQDLSTASNAALTEFRRHNVGFVFQSYNLMPNLNALQNLGLIGELVDDPLDAEEVLRLVGLDDRKLNYPSQLSGGQQQRVSIARALVKNPQIVLADEPTAALDYATSIEVLQVLERVVRAGTTLVMVTHNEEITRMADRVVRMRGGRMHEVAINRHPAEAKDLVW